MIRAEPAGRPTAGGVARSTLAVSLIVLSVLCLTLSPLSIWARNLVLDTDGWVATMSPLASSSQMQHAVVNAVEKQVDAHLDVNAYIAKVLPPRAVTVLGPTLRNATLSLVGTVTTKFVQSPEFQRLWNGINRTAHQQVDNLLTGGSTLHGVLQVRSDNIVLDLSQVVAIVKQRLVAAGITVAARVPNFGATITIAHIQGFSTAQGAVRALNTVANLLPWLGLALAALALVAARRRIRAGTALALGVGGGMCVLGLALMVGEHYFTGALVARGVASATATVLFDTIVRNLREAIRIILVCGLLVGAGVWTTRFVPRIQLPPELRDRLTSPLRTPVARFVALYAMPLRVGVVAVSLAILILVDGPPLALIVILACLVALALGLIELCRRAPALVIAGPAEAGPPAEIRAHGSPSLDPGGSGAAPR